MAKISNFMENNIYFFNFGLFSDHINPLTNFFNIFLLKTFFKENFGTKILEIGQKLIFVDLFFK